MKNILVLPCGTDEALEINRSLGWLLHCKLYGIEQSGSNKGKFIFRNFLGELDLYASEFIDRLNHIVEQNDIDILFPASSTAAIILSQNLHNIKIKVMVPTYETFLFCKAEEKTSTMFQDLLQPFTDCEFEVCCLTDRLGTLRYYEVVKTNRRLTETKLLDLIPILSNRINEHIQFKGAWTYKVKKKKNQPANLRIVPGVDPLMGYCRNKGINLIALSFFDNIGHEFEVPKSNLHILTENFYYKKYKAEIEYNVVYMDLDDTIIVNEQINTLIIAFIFQCRNQGKEIHLITKHRFELQKTLEKYRIQNLFDSIIWLKQSEEKYRYMNKEHAIFIDDAFSERKKVSETLEIPTFEVSAVECLMDWKL